MRGHRRPVQTAIGLLTVWLLLLASGYAAGHLIVSGHPGWDASGVRAIRGPARGTLPSIMRTITALGGSLVLDVVFIVAMGALLVGRHWRDVLFLVLASPGTVLLVQILKRAVHRHRPPGHHLAGADGFSWPSGHASSSSALYAGLLLVGLAHWRTSRERDGPTLRVAIGLTVLLVALIGFSRVYLGVHYPTDVIASWLLVAVWLTALERTTGHSPTRTRRELAERCRGG